MKLIMTTNNELCFAVFFRDRQRARGAVSTGLNCYGDVLFKESHFKDIEKNKNNIKMYWKTNACLKKKEKRKTKKKAEKTKRKRKGTVQSKQRLSQGCTVDARRATSRCYVFVIIMLYVVLLSSIVRSLLSYFVIQFSAVRTVRTAVSVLCNVVIMLIVYVLLFVLLFIWHLGVQYTYSTRCGWRGVHETRRESVPETCQCMHGARELSHDFWGTPRTFRLVRKHKVCSLLCLTKPRTSVFTKSKEVWVTALIPPLEQWQIASRAMRAGVWGSGGTPRDTVNLRTDIMDFRGSDSSIILILRGGFFMSIGDFPESLSQRILVGII